MKKLLVAISLVFCASLALAQTSKIWPGPTVVDTVDATGPCGANGLIWINYLTGQIWYCSAATWGTLYPTVDAAKITTGTIATARLGSGTANSSTFLRGDQTYAAPTASAAWGSITGTLSNQSDLQTALNAKEASGTFSGVGACGANTWASTLVDNTTPTCTQPGFSNLSGAAIDAQVPNTITVDLAAAATALAADPADCATSTHFAVGVNAAGTATCEAIADADVPNTITVDLATLATTATTANAGDSATAFFPAGALEVTRGGTGAAPGADDQVLVSDSSSAATWRTLTDCQGAGKAMTYTTSSNTWGCNTISGSGPTTVVLSADRTNATTSYADITDLSFSLAAATRYKISCVFKYDANATTTGIGIGWTGPASPTFTTGQMIAPLTTATVGGTISAGNDTGAVTTASAATTLNVATFDGIWSNGANAGTLQMRFKSEVAVASAIIIKAGSACDAAVY